MKTNAIVRIILFSLAIVVLGGILIAGIGLQVYSFNLGNLTVFTGRGDSISDGEQISTGSVSADHVRSLEIEWVAGSITLLPDPDATQITFQESGKIPEGKQLVWKKEGDTLKIQFQESTVVVGIGGTTLKKDLVITVPANWDCTSLEIDAASAEVTVRDLTVREVDFDGASGICRFENCKVGEMDMDTASGDIYFEGQLDTLDVDAMSANCVILAKSAPRQIDVDTMSGDVDLTLPEGCGFTASVDAMSSDFSTDFETTTVSGQHTHGDGQCKITVDGMSGKVRIRKGA